MELASIVSTARGPHRPRPPRGPPHLIILVSSRPRACPRTRLLWFPRPSRPVPATPRRPPASSASSEPRGVCAVHSCIPLVPEFPSSPGPLPLLRSSDRSLGRSPRASSCSTLLPRCGPLPVWTSPELRKSPSTSRADRSELQSATPLAGIEPRHLPALSSAVLDRFLLALAHTSPSSRRRRQVPAVALLSDENRARCPLACSFPVDFSSMDCSAQAHRASLPSSPSNWAQGLKGPLLVLITS
ncbi:lysine-rich arabinogalactan protein 19 isoform X1 [Triticum aestivum]|uniref:lysine-rich arabinogalactan protein 19 isoform X1 n=2 Tax=Triticum aestivum TaxID=4565 RepID=UPI001D0350C9|nr:lysine-rich arabinogalactan protein 19-like isoform X1 [Triticum aestivum]